MNNEIGAYDVQFSYLNEEGKYRHNTSRLVIARNADTAIGVVRNSFPTAEVSQVVKRRRADEILVDSAISIGKKDEDSEEEVTVAE